MRNATLLAFPVMIALAVPVASADPPYINLCDDVTLEAEDIIIDYAQDTGDAIDEVVLDINGSTEEGIAADIDFDAETVDFVAGGTTSYSVGTNCVTPSGSSVQCEDCDDPYDDGGFTIYECNNLGGCFFTAGSINGWMDDGAELGIRIQNDVIILGRIHIQNIIP